MKIFSTSQIRAWDEYTITHEPISSIALMERASSAFVKWFCARFDNHQPIKIFCGMGNNGGDGLAIARLLHQQNYQVEVFLLKHSPQGSPDFETNLARFSSFLNPRWLVDSEDFPPLLPSHIIIDALLGSGLSRAASGTLADCIQHINQSTATIISVDIASGLFADFPNAPDNVIVKPTFTVSFQCPKLAFLLPQNADYVGDWQVVEIGLHPEYKASTPYLYTPVCPNIGNSRQKYAHKGSFGHALLIAGSYGKIGAAVLAAKACLRAGVGLLTVQLPRCGYDILQTSLPEAMVSPDWHWMVNTTVPDLKPYSAIGVGPGLGKDSFTLIMLKELLKSVESPMVIDADALNLISENPELLSLVPHHSILTPHPKEFQRLLGKTWDNDFQKIEELRNFSQKHNVIVCLKGAHTAIALPDGSVHFNSTGNPGMATGGSGDVLTGIITALLAQGISPIESAIFGVYQHGLAGDRAAQKCTQPALIASDIINAMGW